MPGRQQKRAAQFVQIGLFAVAIAVVAFATFYILTNFSSGRRQYRIGVHFPRASGVSQGAQVFFSGVEVGTVDEIRLLPDNSVDLILAIAETTNIPKNSKFSVRPPLTGSPTIVITPPVSSAQLHLNPTPLPPDLILEKRILPVSQQPVGTNPVSLEEMVAQGQQLMGRSTRILTTLRGYKRPILADLQGTRSNAAATLLQMRSIAADAQASMRSTLARLQQNLLDAKAALRRHNDKKLAALAASLRDHAASLNSSLHELHGGAAGAESKANMRQSAIHLRVAMSNVAALQSQLRGLSKDQQVRLDLADASAQLRAALQRLASLLKTF